MKTSVSNRLLFEHKIYHSKNYTRTGDKRSDYVVKYAKDDSTFSFASICYFVQLKELILIAVNELIIDDFILSKTKGLLSTSLMRLKNKGLFLDYFFHVKITEDLTFITADQILSKCILFKKDKLNLIVADFTSYNEHD